MWSTLAFALITHFIHDIKTMSTLIGIRILPDDDKNKKAAKYLEKIVFPVVAGVTGHVS
jgi:hypothetical protein